MWLIIGLVMLFGCGGGVIWRSLWESQQTRLGVDVLWWVLAIGTPLGLIVAVAGFLTR